MRVDAFFEILRSQVDDFEAWWRLQASKNTEHFPDEMPEGDWLEQFLMFCTNQE